MMNTPADRQSGPQGTGPGGDRMSPSVRVRDMSAVSMAYLVSQYPAVRHTFILREVQQLRRLGVPILTISVRDPQFSPDIGEGPEVQEAARTFYIKSRGWWKVLGDHLACSFRRPLRYLAGLFRAFQFGAFDLKAILYHLFYFLEAISVGQWLHRNGLTHLHVHFANSGAIVALLIERVYGIPYSVTVHGSDEFYDVRFYHLREVIEHASFVCCISRFCRSQLMKETSPEHWEKLEVAPLGVDPSIFLPRRVDDQFFTIACIGGLVFGKGQMGLIAAIAELKRRGRSVRLELVGDGPARAALEREASRLNIIADVTFHGFVGQDRVREILARASLFVLPSFAEGVPVSLMEAMSMEVPCISTYVGGIPELIQSGQHGILIAPGDTGLLVDAIEGLIDNPVLGMRLAKAGRRKIIEEYNLQNSTDNLLAIYERRLATPSARSATAAANA